MRSTVTPGVPDLLGATTQSAGTNFALFSEHADGVELCLFDAPDAACPSEVIDLPGQTNGVFHGHVGGVSAGQVYGYRVNGPWDPASGHRFDPCKTLLDPYARAVARHPRWGPTVYSYCSESYPDPSALDQTWSRTDSGADSPLGIVIDAAAAIPDTERPRTEWRDTVIYELHVRGFTKLHPDVPAAERGTYAGLASEPVLEYLQGLGVTAVELLPVQHHVNDHWLENKGLTNYWGYQPLAYFAPEPSYSSVPGAGAVDEFREMVRRFHQRGIEVILDVVYNHTGEGGHPGPTLSFRGIDNATYYRLEEEDRRRYVDFTGCGNTFNTYHPAVVRLVLDSLRYWVEVMGVDGFRFDLAVSLGRGRDRYDRFAPLLSAIGQDPVLRAVKLIAEPWDLGSPDGDQLGNFPAGWAEWNRAFRDDSRRFWRGEAGMGPALATRLAGSSDVFGHRQRSPQASVNFVTAHDGFTLMDLVSYNHKRNGANGEGDRDGEHANHSWNCGAEGSSDDPAVLALRGRQRRNLLATVLLSQGVPMLMAGDEFGRTQNGNNNAYCQDNETTWIDWKLAGKDSLVDFVRNLVRLRASDRAFRSTSFFEGITDPTTGLKDVTWLRTDGTEMASSDWQDPDLRCFGMMLPAAGRRSWLILANGSGNAQRFTLPDSQWTVEVDTRSPRFGEGGRVQHGYLVSARCLAVLRTVQHQDGETVKAGGIP